MKKLIIVSMIIFLLLFTSNILAKEEPIKILGAMPMSGDASNIGPAYDKAIQLAIEEINSQDIKGFSKIEYRLIDTESQPSVFDKKLRREIQRWQPDVCTGIAIEQVIRVINTYAPEYKLPTFIGGHLGISKHMPPGEVLASKWVNYYGYADFFAGQLAGQFFKEMNVIKVGFVGGDFDWGYTNGMGLKYYWQNNEKPFEIKPVIYAPFDKTDFSTEIAIIKREKPDAIFCPYMGAGWFSFVKQLRDAGAMPDYFLYGTTYSNMGGAKITGAYGAENIYTLADHNPESEEWLSYVKKWQNKYGERSYPEAYTNNHYQIIYYIKELFEKAGTKDPEVIIETAQNTSFQNVCISPIGPMGPYGSNLGAKGAVIKFVPGASELDPAFDLHPELIKIYDTPKMNVQEILHELKDEEILMSDKEYKIK